MDKIQLIVSLATLAALVATAVLAVFKPNAKQDADIGEMRATCKERHKAIDGNQAEIKNELAFIRDNHLKHIEESIGQIRTEQATIRTILDERLPKKQ